MAGYTFHFTDDVHAYLDAVLPFLKVEPLKNGTLLRVSQRMAEQPELDQSCLWAWATDESGHIVLAAMQTPPFPVAVSPGPDAAVVQLAHELVAGGRSLPGVTGDVAACEAFKNAWVSLTSQQALARHHMRMLTCERLIAPVEPAGFGRVAGEEHYDLIETWLHEFLVELDLTEGPNDMLRDNVRAGHFWLWWVDDEPVCLVGDRPSGDKYAHVGPVYTPPQHRRQGYGAALTALATGSYLAEGRIGSLFTDAANPTSNHIYESIGYHYVGDAIEFSFVD
jgi:predicted GNAT family acetyltransferase